MTPKYKFLMLISLPNNSAFFTVENGSNRDISEFGENGWFIAKL
jgi:hypothetical protein